MVISSSMKMAEGSPKGQKTLWEREKLLIMSNFSFFNSVFKRLVPQTHKNKGLFGKGLKMYICMKGLAIINSFFQTMTVQFENQKKNLEKTLKVKKEKMKESATLRLKEKGQKMTSALVQKHSEQMLDLLAAKKEELRKDLEKELEAQVNSMA